MMVGEPARVREREWMAERLADVALGTAEVETETPEAGANELKHYLGEHGPELLRASLLLFQRVGLDLATRVGQGFGFEEALRIAASYLPEAARGTKSDRDLGEQPLARRMTERGMRPADLVAASNEQLTHKMVTRAMKGRRLTPNTMGKVLRAWNKATESEDGFEQLFNYQA